MNAIEDRKAVDARMTHADKIIARAAKNAKYRISEIRAGITFSDRKARRAHPPGSFDNAGRFDAAERTVSVNCARTPSRNWSYSELTAARTAAHCADLFDAESELAVKRVCRARDLLEENPDIPKEDLKRVLKPVR